MHSSNLLSAARLPDAVKSNELFDFDLLRLRVDGPPLFPEGWFGYKWLALARGQELVGWVS